MEFEITKVPAAGRYEVRAEGELIGLAEYYEQGDVVVVPHTEVDPGHQGQGIAGKMVRFVLDDIRAAGKRVDPQCPYVDRYLTTHPEYAELRADG